MIPQHISSAETIDGGVGRAQEPHMELLQVMYNPQVLCLTPLLLDILKLIFLKLNLLSGFQSCLCLEIDTILSYIPQHGAFISVRMKLYWTWSFPCLPPAQEYLPPCPHSTTQCSHKELQSPAGHPPIDTGSSWAGTICCKCALQHCTLAVGWHALDGIRLCMRFLQTWKYMTSSLIYKNYTNEEIHSYSPFK